jgi:hypothetical protein
MVLRIFLTTLICSVVFTSYSQSTTLVGDWQITECSMNLKDLSPIFLANIKKNLLSTTYTFYSDSTFRRTADIDSDIGKWEVKKGSKVLNLYNSKISDGRPEKFTYIFISPSQMNWVQDYGELGFFTLRLVRMN